MKLIGKIEKRDNGYKLVIDNEREYRFIAKTGIKVEDWMGRLIEVFGFTGRTNVGQTIFHASVIQELGAGDVQKE